MAWYRTYGPTDVPRRTGGGFGLALLLLLAVLAVAAIATGIVYFRQTEGTTEIIIDRERIEQGSERMAEEGKELMREAGEGLKKLGEDESARSPDSPNRR